jgi:uncharacterized protein
MFDWITQPWPWYVAGPLIGLTVPLLLILGNKTFGISSSLRHICAACVPGKVSFFQYNWKKESWNLFFASGILIGAFLTTAFLINPQPMQVSATLIHELSGYGINQSVGMAPEQLFGWPSLLSVRGLVLMVGGGFLVGFGARYAGGCTSGHSIMGLSTLQWPSLVATLSFMAGGFMMSNLLLPYILSL